MIIEKCGADTAAGLAAAYRGGGKSDWFLPSGDEVGKMHDKRSEIGGLSLNSDYYYWTSDQTTKPDCTHCDEDWHDAKTHSFGGWWWASTKDKARAVRPVRAF